MIEHVAESDVERRCGGCSNAIRKGDEYYKIPLQAKTLLRCAACGLRMIEDKQAYQEWLLAKAASEEQQERDALQEEAADGST